MHPLPWRPQGTRLDGKWEITGNEPPVASASAKDTSFGAYDVVYQRESPIEAVLHISWPRKSIPTGMRVEESNDAKPSLPGRREKILKVTRVDGEGRRSFGNIAHEPK